MTHFLNYLYSSQCYNVTNLPNSSNQKHTGVKAFTAIAALLNLNWGEALNASVSATVRQWRVFPFPMQLPELQDDPLQHGATGHRQLVPIHLLLDLRKQINFDSSTKLLTCFPKKLRIFLAKQSHYPEISEQWWSYPLK